MSGSRRHSRFRRGRPNRHHMIVVAFIAVLLSLLGPGLTASAQLENEGTPVSEETAGPDSGEGEFDIRRAEPGDLVIELNTCPAGFDLATDWLGDCTVLSDGVGFTLVGEGVTQSGTTGDDAPGRTRFDALASGTYQVTQATPSDTASTFVWGCFVLDGASMAPIEPLSYGNVLTYTMDPGESYLCEWYNIPADDGSSGTGQFLSLTVNECPVGHDPTTDGIARCSTPVDGVGFAVSGPSGNLAGTTGDTIPGGTQIAGLAPGDYAITMTPPAGTAASFLWACSVIETPSEAPSAPLAVGATHTLTVVAENDYLCRWYVVPGDSSSGDDETGTVRVSKYTCPEGVAPSDDDYLLSEQCREDVAPVSFEVSDSAGADLPLTLNAGVPQNGELSGLAFGTVWIAEIVPEGYGEPRVFCSDIPSDGAGNYEPVPVVGGNAIEVELRADAEMPLICLFFNFPGGDDDGDTGTVHVSKYTCPDGVERSTDDYLLSEQCREDIDPVDFTVVATAGGYEQTVTANPGVPQSATFADVPFGEIAIEEAIPAGYGHPLVFCADTAADGPGAYAPVEPWPESGAFIVDHRADAEIDLSCIFLNFPEGDDDPGNTVTVNKYVCPSWVNPESDVLLDACAPGGDGIPFTFVDGNGMHPAPVSGGSVTWTDVVIGAEGELQIIEDIPAGYGDPWVVCDGILMASANGFVIPNPGEARPFHVECDWFNLALEDAALAVVKHTCAPGYDPHAAGADPMADCSELTDGVDFRIAGMGADMTSTTGDAGPGKVQFGGLDPGPYTLTETVPAGTAVSFVLDCYGNELGAVRPYPLATGDTLDLTLHAGENVTCHWFNVAESEGGALRVIKYRCAGDAYVSEVDCEIHEGGVTFDLVVRDGDAWVTVDTATTDDHGRIAWLGLEPGRYWLGERGGEWCHIASSHLDDDPAGIVVEPGKEAVVKVYNCGAEPGKPGETPTKYPDTGVPPAGASNGGGDPVPAVALAGLLAVPLTRRRLAALGAVAAAGLAGRAIAQDGDAVIAPTDGTAGPAAPEASLCLPSSEAGCERGPVPASLRIDAIGVDAPVEILETVAGEMQQPTDARHVAWYKETARLHEPGNMLLAGHLNWWGVPEAVFYHLARLQAGDAIVIAGEDGDEARYEVEWVRNVPAGEAPGDDVLGMNSRPAATLITCGGAWDAASSAYEERTVVRTVLVGAA